ncbi:MAG: serine/threonine-protein phosphatase [Candidatus Nanopelagicaceae bacterium]|nr:serine/threonine-protein phosphatase [Candidatus Nanopelagicaceae bacterium]
MQSIGARFNAIGRSEVGLHRSGNEDSALINGVLIAVADGMGGHAGGEVASKVAISTLAQILPLLNNDEMDPESLEDFLLNAILEVDNEIKLTAEANDRLSGMGTTLTAIALYRNKAYVLHTGDSRAYRLRGKEFTQLTKDHSVVQELIDAGTITEAEAAVHPQRSVLTNVLMGLGNITPLLVQYDVKAGDKFLLCSDGLTNVISNAELHKKMTEEDALSNLISLTYERGAPDNVTVVIAEVGTGDTVTEFFGAAK